MNGLNSERYLDAFDIKLNEYAEHKDELEEITKRFISNILFRISSKDIGDIDPDCIEQFINILKARAEYDKLMIRYTESIKKEMSRYTENIKKEINKQNKQPVPQ